MTICLCMIVKDESRVIKRCLSSVKPFIDSWSIVDTGSTDDTKEIIRSELRSIPGALHERPWINFGVNRTESIALAKGKADYLLLLDADMIAVGEFSKNLSTDGYLIQYLGSLQYSQELLVKSTLDWRYVGSTHEYITASQARTRSKLQGLQIDHRCDGRRRGQKLQQDVELLLQELSENPSNGRAMFYLAQSYRDLGRNNEAIDWYLKRVDAGGWDEEVWYAKYQATVLSPFDADAFLELYQSRPARVEPLYHLIRYYREHKQFDVGYLFAESAIQTPIPDDILFIHKDFYDWRVKDEASLCAYYSGRHKEAERWSQDIEGIVPRQEYLRVKKNRMWIRRQINKKQSWNNRTVIGLGTGRCGTVSLRVLLNLQPFVFATHEGHLLPWESDTARMSEALESIQKVGFEFSGDVGFYWLPYVPQLVKKEPDVKFVCLKRDKQETVASYMTWTQNKNHWSKNPSSQWVSDRYDECYPKYDLDKQPGLEQYYDDYYAQAESFQEQFSHNFKVFPIDTLNSQSGQNSILEFVGIPDCERRTSENLYFNCCLT